MNHNNNNQFVYKTEICKEHYDFLAFLRIILIWLGAISLIMALLLFMAYNWNELGKFYKFLIVEAVMEV